MIDTERGITEKFDRNKAVWIYINEKEMLCVGKRFDPSLILNM